MDLIDRQAALDKFEPWLKVKGYSEGELNMLKAILYELKVMPSAERKGHWYKNSTLINCSVCKHCSWSVNAYEDLVKTFKYCPNCGARMDGE